MCVCTFHGDDIINVFLTLCTIMWLVLLKFINKLIFIIEYSFLIFSFKYGIQQVRKDSAQLLKAITDLQMASLLYMT